MNISLTVNGKRHELEVKPGESLREALRGLGCTSVKQGCGAGECGACTVLVDGVPQTSCNMLAVQADGKAARTVEGEAKGGELSPVQQAFIENKAFQCGFCTPGLVMTTTALAESGRGGDMTRGRSAGPSPGTCAAARATIPSWTPCARACPGAAAAATRNEPAAPEPGRTGKPTHNQRGTRHGQAHRHVDPEGRGGRPRQGGQRGGSQPTQTLADQ